MASTVPILGAFRQVADVPKLSAGSQDARYVPEERTFRNLFLKFGEKQDLCFPARIHHNEGSVEARLNWDDRCFVHGACPRVTLGAGS